MDLTGIYFSVIIPTMWKSDKIHQMLDVYQKNELVKEIIIIDNNPLEKPNLEKYSKIIYYTEGKNLYVNPSWNIGYTLSSYKTILANDDIVIINLNDTLLQINESNYDIIGIDLTSNNENKVFIDELRGINVNIPLGDQINGFGCFMFVKEYTYIPNNIKIWYGDDFLLHNSIKRGILKNLKLDFSISQTVKHIKNTIGTNIFEEDKKNFNKYKQNIDTSNKNVLVSLVNFGEEQINYLSQVVTELKTFKKYNVTIVVNSNVPLHIDGIDKVNIINNLKDFQLLPLTCRKTIWENKDNFDIFIYGENDHLFKEHHIDKHIEYTKILPKNRISGLIQYEENENGVFYPGYHAHYDWDYNSIEEYDGKKFAHFNNVHQATFILTKEQLHNIGKLHDFTKFLGESKYSVKCKVNTDIYDFGGMKKMICISEFKENLIHHLPNLYIDGEKGRNKNQRADNKKMSESILKLLLNNNSKVINGFYLNLERRQDRRIKMETELKKTTHNIQRYKAIDGTELKSLNGFGATIRNSESKQYATYLSHLNMIKIAKQNGWNKVMILEDDITLCDDFDERIELYLSQLPSDWGIAYIGFTETSKTNLTKVTEYVYRVKEVYGCWGMIINSSMYDKLLRIGGEKNTVIDWVIKDYIQPNYGCYVFMPFLAYVNDDYSDLWNTHRKLGMIKKYFKNRLIEDDIESQEEFIPQESNLEKLKKLMNLTERKKVEINYENINNTLSKKENFYKTNSSLKPLRENIPQNRNEITQLKKDSLTKTSRDLFSKGKKYKG